MNKTYCSHVNGYHCDCYNRGACEYIAYCTYQRDNTRYEDIEKLKERIRELEFENEKLKFEVKQARASRDMWADIPSHLRDDRVGPLMSAEEILNVIRGKE